MLIPGGLGETEESKEIAARMIERIREAHGKGDRTTNGVPRRELHGSHFPARQL